MDSVDVLALPSLVPSAIRIISGSQSKEPRLSVDAGVPFLAALILASWLYATLLAL